MNHELKSTKINKELKRHGLIIQINTYLDHLSYDDLLTMYEFLNNMFIEKFGFNEEEI